MSVLARLRRVFREEENEPPDSVRSAESVVEQYRQQSSELRDTIDRTGYLLGDAVFGRLDRRYLPGRGKNEPTNFRG